MPIRIVNLITALLLLSALSVGCRKSKSDQPAAASPTTAAPTVTPPPYTYAIGGSRQWHDTAYTVYTNSVTDTFSHADATFAVDIIDSLHVKFKGVTLTYDPTSSTDSIGYYSSESSNQLGYPKDYDLTYYRYSNHIIISYYAVPGHSAYSYEKWLSF